MKDGHVVQVALGSIHETSSGLAFRPGALHRIRAALAEAMAGSAGGLELDGLLRLGAVLRERRGAPELADALIDVIRSVPEARAAALARVGSARAVDHARGFARREGREVVIRAPGRAEPRPPGSIPASTLLDPTRRDRERARSRARKEAKHGHL